MLSRARYQKDHRIRTQRLFLRPVTNGDVDEYATLLSDPEVMRFVGLEQGHLLSHEETRAVVWSAIETWQKHGYGRWSIFDDQGSFVGFSGFRAEEGKPEFISLIHERYWGSGVARESAEAVLHYGFSSLAFREVKSFCRPKNVKARRLMEKLGAEFIGIVNFYGVEGAAYRLSLSH